ncbi:DNA metabolism protein [Lithospermum erythrorhizon]|uniref:DNA polymerase eta n=1 Tax=Lithospermum erythrorhizon TaxID=34254 RepID=A0AAV3Q2I9_LITER
MPVSRPETSDSRVIAHVDMDCFYVQVEQRKLPHLRSLPTAVVQYNDWKGGGLIAVSYEARKFGVERSMRGDEAKEVCPDIQLVQVPVGRGKADLTIYRNAGSEVVSILSTKGRCERASIDEVYLDLTEAAQAMLVDSSPEISETVREEALKSHVLGLDLDSINIREKVRNWFGVNNTDHRDKLLACGALLIAELRMKVLEETEFTCSAGIAHNKMLAKLVSGMNKPAQQTVVPFSSVKKLLDPLPIKKMKHLGGKLGTSLQIDLGVNTVGDLLKYSEAKLQEYYGTNTGTWLWNTARGINGEEVQGRVLTKSHGSGKTFPGSRALRKMDAVEKWLKELSAELSDRLQADLEQNKRLAKTLTLHANAFQVSDSDSVRKFPSKSCPLRYGVSKIQEDAFMLFQAGLREYIGPFKVKFPSTQPGGWRITGLSVIASKLEAIPSGTRSITNYFNSLDHNCCPLDMLNDKCTHEAHSFQNEKGEATHWYLSDGDCSGILEPEKCVVDVEHVEEYSMRNSSQENGGVLDHENGGVLNQENGGVLNKEENSHEVQFRQYPNSSMPSPNQPNDDLGKEKTLSSSECQNYLGLDQTKAKTSPMEKELACTMESKGRSTKSPKDKEMYSIERYFQKWSPCTSKPEYPKNILESNTSSGSQLLSSSPSELKMEGVPHDNLRIGSVSEMGRHGLGLDEQSSMWSYEAGEIDPVIFNELPVEIQNELRASIRPRKRANICRKDSIDHYFLPSKGS